jgi:hypothetical protein
MVASLEKRHTSAARMALTFTLLADRSGRVEAYV